ncbi:hypothetical protein ABHN84_20520 [Shewanella vesiculosa]|uniref:Uncharacterized protein n=1 Tax=Shewanella vesiculosa TaxID=518738 RepID=A0ABV0FYH0_9GAMM
MPNNISEIENKLNELWDLIAVKEIELSEFKKENPHPIHDVSLLEKISLLNGCISNAYEQVLKNNMERCRISGNLPAKHMKL